MLLIPCCCVGVTFPFNAVISTDSLPVAGCACYRWCQQDPGRPTLGGKTAGELGMGWRCQQNLCWVPNPMPDLQSAKVAGDCMLGWPGMGAWVGCVIMVRYAWAWCEMVAGGTWLGMVWWQLWTRGQCGVCMALTKSALSPGRRLASLEWASPQENSRAWCTASRLSSKSLWVLIQMS